MNRFLQLAKSTRPSQTKRSSHYPLSTHKNLTQFPLNVPLITHATSFLSHLTLSILKQKKRNKNLFFFINKPSAPHSSISIVFSIAPPKPRSFATPSSPNKTLFHLPLHRRKPNRRRRHTSQKPPPTTTITQPTPLAPSVRQPSPFHNRTSPLNNPKPSANSHRDSNPKPHRRLLRHPLQLLSLKTTN